MQSVSSRIWTRIVVSNSYDDNHYTTGTSNIGHGSCKMLKLRNIANLSLNPVCPFVFYTWLLWDLSSFQTIYDIGVVNVVVPTGSKSTDEWFQKLLTFFRDSKALQAQVNELRLYTLLDRFASWKTPEKLAGWFFFLQHQCQVCAI